MRKIKAIVIHCSATNRHTTTTKSIRDYHMAPKPKGNGWKDIGYHGVIEGNGSFHVGRPVEQTGAHAEGYNTGTLGICVTGNFDIDVMTEDHPQFKTLVQVVATWCKRYGVKPEDIIGHRDVYGRLGQKVAKSCPGNSLYKLLPRLRELVGTYLTDD